MIRCHLPFLFSLVTLPLLPAATAAAQPKPAASAEDTTRVRSLYRQGAAAYSAGKYEEARNALREAWSIRQTYDVAAALGQAELELKLYRDAAEHLRFAVNNFAPVESEQSLEALKRNLKDATARVTEVNIVVNEAGAQVAIDGKTVSVAPLLSSVFVEPGKHVVRATLDEQVVEQPLEAVAGRQETVKLHLTQPPKASASTNTTAPPGASAGDAGSSETPRTVALIVGGTLAVAGIGTAIGFGLASNSAEDDAENAGRRVAGQGCSGSESSSDCKSLRTAVDDQRSNGHIANIGYGIAAIGLATVGVALLWPRSKRSTRASSQPPLSLHVTSNAVYVGGSF
jgi:hypothetical protein